jgi:hypothetical protein
MVALLLVMVALVVAAVDNMIHSLVLQEQQELVVLDHKVVTDLVDTQEQVVVRVPHLELLVTLV